MSQRGRGWMAAAAVLLGVGLGAIAWAQPAAEEPALTGAERLRADAGALGRLVTSDIAMQFLDAARAIEDIEARTIYLDRALRTWYTPEQASALPEEQRATLREVSADTAFYLGTLYGSPLAFVRALDIAGQCGAQPALDDLSGKRILDFGYGNIGHLRMMAACGADVVGVDVDTLQPALYREPGDTGVVPGLDGGPEGRITLVHGRWPAEEAARGGVGGGYDLIVSKNTLKKGYIHPEREADPRQLVRLGVNDIEFMRAVYDALKPGGLLVIYNLSPAPSKPDEPYKPWADGRCPFNRFDLERIGFRVIALDVDDSGPARDMARALGWDRTGMDVQNDLFALVTIAWKPGGEVRP